MSARSEVAEATRRLRVAPCFKAIVAIFALEVTASETVSSVEWVALVTVSLGLPTRPESANAV